MTTRRNPPEEIKDEDDVLMVSVRLKSGKFESSIEIPLFSDDAAKKAFVDAWLTMMEAGIKCAGSARDNRKAKESGT